MRAWRIAALSALACAAATAAFAADAPTISTRQGQISGKSQLQAFAYLGVPFAAPPVGPLRWKAPQAPAAWNGVRDGSKFAANCYQASAGGFGPYTPEFIIDASPVSEDCLYLNVWTPQSGAKNLPVLVWIHGGGFGGGSGSIPIYDGARLAAKGAVVVTINYRVGAFGFLAHPALTAENPAKTSGNYGLLDMIAALQWVQANAASFGGDASRVTVAGQSAGAMAINALFMSPNAKGLFSGAIAESGTAAGAVSMSLADAEAEGQSLAAQLGAATLADMRAVSPAALQAASRSGPPTPGAPRRLRAALVVDGKVVIGDAKDPAAPAAVNVPLLSGYNRDEGVGVTIGAASTPAAFEASVRRRFGDRADAVLALYPHADDAQATASAALLPRDMVTATLAAWNEVRSKTTGQTTYAYLFDHVYPGPEAAKYGVFHTAEVPYVFGVLDQNGRPFGSADRAVSEQIQAYWLAFMRTGKPDAAGLPAWPKGSDGRTVMKLGDTPGAAPAASTPQRLQVLHDAIVAQGYAAFI